MAAEMLGGASATELAAEVTVAEPEVAHPPLDLNFVGEVVQGAAWSSWGERFSNLDELLARIQEKLLPGQRVRRLALASYSADHTSGYMAFDTGLTSRERIDGLNQTPIRAEVAAKLERLRPLLSDDGIVELRVAGVGHGDHGRKALQALADILGVPARGPLEKAISMAPSAGLVTDWLTVYPSARGVAPVHSGWRETRQDGATRAIDAAYVPVPGEPAPPVLPSSTVQLQFATENAVTWAPTAHRVTGIKDLVDRAIELAAGRPIGRLAVLSMGSKLYDGFVAFDNARGDGESVDGNIREEPDYPHLQVIYHRVREELERLQPHLAPGAELEFRVARLGAGDAGRRALQKLADAAGAAVRAPAGSLGEFKANRGLATRWITVMPSNLGIPPVESAWREVSEPAPPRGPWVPLEAAAFVPLRGVDPPVPPSSRPATPAAEPVPAAATAREASPASTLTLVVRCAGCGRLLDEAPATPMKARLPCPGCGSIARTRALETPRGRAASGGGVRQRLRHAFTRTSPT